MSSPFSNFEPKKDNPETWNAQNIVCYYVLLFKYEYGHEPAVNWRMDLGAATNLLKAFEDYESPSLAVKHYLQLSFALMKKTFVPQSLTVFTQSWVINQARGKWEHMELVDDYRDHLILGHVG
jgi:hypothetical protein